MRGILSRLIYLPALMALVAAAAVSCATPVRTYDAIQAAAHPDGMDAGAVPVAFIDSAGFVTVNGVGIHYVVKGSSDGRPVVLLHGNGGSHRSLSDLTEDLAANRCLVYALDSRGQGDNDPLPEYHYDDMADDVYEFIRGLGLGRPAVYGHSDGGIVALSLEIRHPGTASMLMASGANVTPDGVDASTRARWKEKMEKSPSPLTAMMVNEPDITSGQLGGISCPVLIMAGTGDIITVEHTRYIARSIPGSELIILDGEGHSTYIRKSPVISTLVLGFLELHDNNQ